MASHIQTKSTAAGLLIGCEILWLKNTIAGSQEAKVKTLSSWPAWHGLLQEAAVFG
jgi:hypothetical protein